MATKSVLYDRDIREPLFEFLEDTFGKARILEEKRAGRARVDVLMITDSALYGIEIKSDADTYVRLENQVKFYDLFFDKNVVVAGSSHAAHIEEHIPEHWGIITVEPMEDGGADFYMLREPKSNPNMRPDIKITLLWRRELNNILDKNGLPGYRYKSKAFVQEKLLEKIPEEELWPQVHEELFERDYTTIAQEINEYREAHGQKKRRRKRYKRLKKSDVKV